MTCRAEIDQTIGNDGNDAMMIRRLRVVMNDLVSGRGMRQKLDT